MRGKIPIADLKRKRRMDFYEYLIQTYFKKSRNKVFSNELLFIEKNWGTQVWKSADKLMNLPTFKDRYRLRIKLTRP